MAGFDAPVGPGSAPTWQWQPGGEVAYYSTVYEPKPSIWQQIGQTVSKAAEWGLSLYSAYQQGQAGARQPTIDRGAYAYQAPPVETPPLLDFTPSQTVAPISVPTGPGAASPGLLAGIGGGQNTMLIIAAIAAIALIAMKK